MAAGVPQSGTINLVVAKHQISSAEVVAKMPPLDRKHSHGVMCGTVNDFPTKGYKRTGGISSTGRFNYVFMSKTHTAIDKMTFAGRFVDAKHVRGTFRDVFQDKAGKSHCDTGSVSFSAEHS